MFLNEMSGKLTNLANEVSDYEADIMALMFTSQYEKNKFLSVVEILEKELVERVRKRCVNAGRLQATKHLLELVKNELKDLGKAYEKNEQLLMRCKSIHRSLFKQNSDN